MEGKDQEEQERRAAELARILDTAAHVPLDQAGTVLWPMSMLGYWAGLKQRAACAFNRHAWGRAWIFVDPRPNEHQTSRMLKGASWPTEEIQDCACGARRRRRLP